MSPWRFILSAEQMSEGFAAAKCSPEHSPFFDALPVAKGILPSELVGSDGELDPCARRIFHTIAHSCFSLRLLNIVDGSKIGIETRLMSQNGETYVALARPNNEQWDLALVGEREQALALLDELLGASDSADLGKDFSMTLSLPQLAIIAAMAQLARLEDLRARLEGRAVGFEIFTSPIPKREVEAVIAAEKEMPDLGSPLSRLAFMCRGALFEVLEGDNLQHGLEALMVDSLADAEGRLNADGLALVALLMSRDMMTLLQSTQRQADDVIMDSLFFLHGPGSLLTGAWKMDPEGREESLLLSTMQSSELLELVDTVLGPLVLSEAWRAPNMTGGLCTTCGSLYEESPKYCRECGTALAD